MWGAGTGTCMEPRRERLPADKELPITAESYAGNVGPGQDTLDGRDVGSFGRAAQRVYSDISPERNSSISKHGSFAEKLDISVPTTD